MTSHLKAQYELVLQSRQVLFDYCRTISAVDLVNENSSFGRGGSIRNLLVHIANTYEFWVVRHALKKEVAFTEYSAMSTVGEIEGLFQAVDDEMADFLTRYESSAFDSMDLEVNGKTRSVTAFQLFTHVITHEFHHKGQILSLSRHLGYVPVDTDIIR